MTKDTGENLYQQALAESVHHSLKTINSNIEKGGLRLAQSQALNRPYISARTLLADHLLVPTDYQANAGKTATLFKVVKAAQLNEDLSEAEDEFKQNVSALKPYLKTAFEQPFSAGLDHVDIRMRQLLIPKDGDYVSLSPLSAAGVNLLLNNEVDALKEQRKAEAKHSKLKNIQTAVFGIGGSNPQNVGSLVRSMQRPIVLDSPKQIHDIHAGFQFFYKGFEYEISNAYLNYGTYAELTYDSKNHVTQRKLANDLGFNQKGIHSPFSNMATRDAELVTIKKIVNDVLEQGHSIFNTLKKLESELPSQTKLPRQSFWSHPSVPFVAQGLVNQELQKLERWQLDFSNDLALKIINHQHWVESIQSKVSSSRSEQDSKEFLSRRIQELLK